MAEEAGAFQTLRCKVTRTHHQLVHRPASAQGMSMLVDAGP